MLGCRCDSPLSERGQRQARLTGEYLANVTDGLLCDGKARVICSPRHRAHATAKAIAERLGTLPDPILEFDELDFGDWSGYKTAALRAEGKEFDAWSADKWYNAPPNGETLWEVRSRAMFGLESALRLAIPEERHLVIVTHYFPLLAMLGALDRNKTGHADNCAITEAVFSGHWLVQLENHVEHLGADASPPVRYV